MVAQLSEEAREFIERKVREGEFADATGVIDMAVRRAAEQDKRVTELKAALQIGIDQLERGESVRLTPDAVAEIFAEGKRRHLAGETPKRDVLP